MSDSTYVPIPVALVANNMTAIQEAYSRRRADADMTTAVAEALADVLDPGQYQVVMDAISSPQLDFDGLEFGRAIAMQLENAHQLLAEYQERCDRRSVLDMVDLAEDLATDPVMPAAFVDALDRKNRPASESLVRGAAQLLVAKATEADTAIGQDTKMAQGAAVVRRLGKKAAAASRQGQHDAVAQARWCVALHDRLRRKAPARPRRRIDRSTLVVSVIMAAGLALLAAGFASGRTGNEATSLPPAFLVLYPKPGELVLRQSEVGAKLQSGYRATLRIDEQDLPTYDVVANDSSPGATFNQQLDARFDPGQGTVLYLPREGATIAKFAPGDHRITVFYWRVTETQNEAQSFTWNFKVS